MKIPLYQNYGHLQCLPKFHIHPADTEISLRTNDQTLTSKYTKKHLFIKIKACEPLLVPYIA